ncbi:ABC transporter permease subunit [Cytobacillus purgationiresistens]|uniref:Phosphonate transport system permease protein n=1 Tax=Cytobacillus purgationiresistens TaxID=863449 RepID=A0ABU0AP52_9BACI|nr:ABC transporter permease subunit [Cytobacillus purgationiresistens]MDQ0271835.1 phosphonate transport system permease protein [Cytobacillus purgationiresistens]
MNEKAFKRRKLHSILFFLLIIGVAFISAYMTDFNLVEGMATIPTALIWMAENLIITTDTLAKLPKILEKLNETIFMSIAATTIAAAISLFLGIAGSTTTAVNGFFSTLARLIASFARNIPVVAWALILLLSFGQNSITGFLALFVGTVGFLTRAFIESIDEAGSSAYEALTATGATYFQVVGKAIIPQCLPQMISWILFMIETNIRSATLVGILTGTGIGYAFDLYYKMLDYQAVALITLLIVAAVIIIELASNHIRRVIL